MNHIPIEELEKHTVKARETLGRQEYTVLPLAKCDQSPTVDASVSQVDFDLIGSVLAKTLMAKENKI